MQSYGAIFTDRAATGSCSLMGPMSTSLREVPEGHARAEGHLKDPEMIHSIVGRHVVSIWVLIIVNMFCNLLYWSITVLYTHILLMNP